MNPKALATNSRALEPAQAAKAIGDFAPELPRPAVLCTLVQVTGSAPQAVGARMWVSEDRFAGTLGGGEFERRILTHARGMLKEAGALPHLKEYVLCKEMGQCCGGRVSVFFEPVPRRKAVHLFGAGHVGRATAQTLSGMPLDIHLIDARPDWGTPAGLPEDVRAHQDDAMDYARSKAWSAEDAVCIFTHSHDLDFRLAEFFLKSRVGYLGLIGSEHKARVFLARLKSLPRGAELERLWEEKMRCPIGITMTSKNPKIIAVAVASELLKEWAL